MKSDAWQVDVEPRLRNQLAFLLYVDRLKEVVRGNRLVCNTRRENSAEHSWHLILFALVLQDHACDDVDIWRVVQMLVLHDLVEVECGDTPLFDTDQSQGQADREKAAAYTIFGMLPDDQERELRGLWEEFEAAETSDAKFAKALDRFQPILLNHAVGGGTWKDYDVDEQREREMTVRIAESAPSLWEAVEAVYRDAVKKGWLRPSPGRA